MRICGWTTYTTDIITVNLFGARIKSKLIFYVIVLAVDFVGGANEGKSVHSEIDDIVDNVFSNVLKSTDVMSTDLDSRPNERPRQAEMSSRHTFAREHNTDQTRLRDHRQNLHREQIRVDNSFRGKESVQGFRSGHEKVVTGFTAESEDVLSKHTVSVGARSDVNQAQSISMSGSPNAAGNRNVEHDGSHGHSEETDIPVSPAVETTSTGHTDPENIQNVEAEQSLQAKDNVEFTSFESAAGDGAESENEGELLASEVPSGEETFHEDGGSGAEEVHEVRESLQQSSSDQDEDERQREWTAEHDATDIKNDETAHHEEHSDAASGSNSIDELVHHSADEGIADTPPVEFDVLDSDDTDIVLESKSPGWTYSTIDAVCSFIDAVVDVVRHKPSICMC